MPRPHKSVEAVQAAFMAVGRATTARDAAVAETFPEGSKVSWFHGDFRRTAVVVRVVRDQLFVKSQSSEYWVHAYRINKATPPSSVPDRPCPSPSARARG